MSEIENLKLATEKLTELPTLPTVVAKITTLMQNPRTSASEVGQAITTDQSLTSKTLKLVNSAFYGFPGRINTITHAIVILGFTTVKNIVLTASIFDAFGKNAKGEGFNMEDFWLHSIATGAIAKVLAERRHFKYSEEAFIGGILHDIGKVVLNQYATEDFSRILQYQKKHNCLISEAEKAIIHVTHEEVGRWLAQRWNLPRDLALVIQYHSNPKLSKQYQELVAIVHIADIFARALGVGSGGDDKIPVVKDESWDLLQMDKIDLGKFLSRIDSEVDKASVFLQVIDEIAA